MGLAMSQVIQITVPSDLRDRTCFSSRESAILKSIGKTIYLVHRPIAGNTLFQLAPLLNHGVIDPWLTPRLNTSEIS